MAGILRPSVHTARPGGCAVLLEDISAVEVAVLIEVIVDRGMDGGKLLKGLSN